MLGFLRQLGILLEIYNAADIPNASQRCALILQLMMDSVTDLCYGLARQSAHQKIVYAFQIFFILSQRIIAKTHQHKKKRHSQNGCRFSSPRREKIIKIMHNNAKCRWMQSHPRGNASSQAHTTRWVELNGQLPLPVPPIHSHQRTTIDDACCVTDWHTARARAAPTNKRIREARIEYYIITFDSDCAGSQRTFDTLFEPSHREPRESRFPPSPPPHITSGAAG